MNECCRKWYDEAQRLSALGKRAQEVMRQQRDEIARLKAAARRTHDPIGEALRDLGIKS